MILNLRRWVAPRQIQTRQHFEFRFELFFTNEACQWDAPSCYLKSS